MGQRSTMTAECDSKLCVIIRSYILSFSLVCTACPHVASHSGWSFVALNLTSKIINAGEHIHAYEMEIVGKWKPTCLNINNLLFPLHKTFKLNILCISIINGAGLRSNKCDSVVWALDRFWHKKTCIASWSFHSF